MLFKQTDALRPGMILAADLFGPKGEFLLAKGHTLDRRHIARLCSSVCDGVWISEGDEDEAYSEQAHGIISKKLKDNTLHALTTLFHSVNGGRETENRKTFNQLRLCLDGIIDEIIQNENIIANMVDLKNYDDYTYTHSVSVAALAIMVGASFGLSRARLYRLGLGALLHDIGKMFIPKEIVGKAGPLTPDEYEHMKLHCQLGAGYLRNNWEVPVEAIIGVLTHHERCDGSGYPFGLPQSKQTMEGKLIAICDVYDAMTSARPYRTALSPSEAMEHIMGNSGILYDAQMIAYFIRKIAPYPVGARVLLSNGMRGMVTENHPRGLIRPVVEIYAVPEGTAMPENRRLDLFLDPALLNVTIIGLDR